MSNEKLSQAVEILSEFVSEVEAVGIGLVRGDNSDDSTDDPACWPDLAVTYDKAKAFLESV